MINAIIEIVPRRVSGLMCCSKLANLKKKSALIGVTQLVGHRPARREVTGSIPCQGTCLGLVPVGARRRGS